MAELTPGTYVTNSGEAITIVGTVQVENQEIFTTADNRYYMPNGQRIAYFRGNQPIAHASAHAHSIPPKNIAGKQAMERARQRSLDRGID